MSDNAFLLPSISVPKSRVDEFTVRAGGVQIHGIVAAIVDPLKVKIALAGQAVLGTVIFTCSGFPGVSVPFDGEKVIPDTPLLATDQFTVLCIFRLLIVTEQVPL